MSDSPTVGLLLGNDLSEVTARRITYAFRLFCAVYGFTPSTTGGDAVLCYATEARRPQELGLSATYVPRGPAEPAPAPRVGALDPGRPEASEDGARFPVFSPLEEDGPPDWLGEIFEWVSAAHEHSLAERDPLGRVPFDASLHGRYGLDPSVPYAALAMAALNRGIRAALGDGWPALPVSPWGDSGSFAVAATHDVDFLPVGPWAVLHRVSKNAAQAAILRRDPKLLVNILASALRSLGGHVWLNDSLERMRVREREAGISSTLTVICRRSHPRDANYDVEDRRVVEMLRRLAAEGAEIGVHGSYTSLDSPGRLVEEYRKLAALGFEPHGGRQHWLRSVGRALYRELSDAGAWYDCTAGYPGMAGFRHGACFPYPPYDFEAEGPHAFLELPLVIMDASLYAMTRRESVWGEVCSRVMDAAREHGWGGVSLLWHDTTFSGAQLPRGIGECYWGLGRAGERWISAGELTETVWPRYEHAGLLPGRPPGP